MDRGLKKRHSYRCPFGHERWTYSLDGSPELERFAAALPCIHYDNGGHRCDAVAFIRESSEVKSSGRSLRRWFEDLQIDVAARVRELMPNAGEKLTIIMRADRTFWFLYDDHRRRVRTDLTPGKQVVVLLYVDFEVKPRSRVLGLTEKSQDIGEVVVRMLTDPAACSSP